MRSIRIAEEPLQAYNLTVADYHTYFIKGEKGTGGVWVHNDCLNALPPDARTTNIKGHTVYSFENANGKTVNYIENPYWKEGGPKYSEVRVIQDKTSGTKIEPLSPPTPLELIQQQAQRKTEAASIRPEHIIDGEIRTNYKTGNKTAVGGHYEKNPNLRIRNIVDPEDINGVKRALISIRDPKTGQWIDKPAVTNLFPRSWSKRKVMQETESAFMNSKPHPDNREKWLGKSPSGLEIEGYYTIPEGAAATAWPVYKGN